MEFHILKKHVDEKGEARLVPVLILTVDDDGAVRPEQPKEPADENPGNP